jgi:hypothetical protein
MKMESEVQIYDFNFLFSAKKILTQMNTKVVKAEKAECGIRNVRN